MSDIRQAALWFLRGKTLRRVSGDADPTVRYQYRGGWLVAYEGEEEFEEGDLSLMDLLADDWEVLE